MDACKILAKVALILGTYQSVMVAANPADPPSRHTLLTGKTLADARDAHEFQIFKITTKEMFSLFGPKKTYEFKDAIVEVLPNKKDAGQLCSRFRTFSNGEKQAVPEFKGPTPPCTESQFLISFVRHSDGKNEVPNRYECFCVSKDLLNYPTAEKYMSPFDSFTSSDVNVFDKNLRRGTMLNRSVEDKDVLLVAPSKSNEQSGKLLASRFRHSDTSIDPMIEAEPPFELSFGPEFERLRMIARVNNYDTLSRQSNDWKNQNTGTALNPYKVGFANYDFEKQMMLGEYVDRSVGALGSDHSSFAIFHNAWKLARMTRSQNNLSLKDINKRTEQALMQKFKDPEIVKRMLPKFAAVNEYIWVQMNKSADDYAKRNKITSDQVRSENVDREFKLALAGNGHPDLWKKIADIDGEFANIKSTHTGLPQPNTLADVRHISDFPGIVERVLPRGENGFPPGEYGPESQGRKGGKYANHAWHEDFTQFIKENLMNNIFRPLMNNVNNIPSSFCPRFKLLNLVDRATVLAAFFKGIARSESGYNTDSIPQAGIMQLSCNHRERDPPPAGYGCKCSSDDDLRNNPFVNIDCAMKIINYRFMKGDYIPNEYFQSLRKGQEGSPLGKIYAETKKGAGELCGGITMDLSEENPKEYL
jgi:hypothetical protein